MFMRCVCALFPAATCSSFKLSLHACAHSMDVFGCCYIQLLEAIALDYDLLMIKVDFQLQVDSVTQMPVDMQQLLRCHVNMLYMI